MDALGALRRGDLSYRTELEFRKIDTRFASKDNDSTLKSGLSPNGQGHQ
jgi:hypothetical protein